MLRGIFKVNTYVIVAVALVFGGGDLMAKDAKDVWGKEQASKEFQSFFEDKMATPDVIGEKVAAWLKKVDDTKVDLAEEGYAVWLGKYIVADKSPDVSKGQETAVRGLADFIVSKNGLPESAKNFSGFIGGTISGVAREAIAKGDIKKAEKLMATAIDLSANPDSFYAYVGAQLLKTEKAEAHEYLIRLLADALTNKKLSAERKHRILAYIYSNREQELMRKQKMSRAENFVPFKGIGVDGKEVGVADYKGKVLLVDFWASWCGPCIAYMPTLVGLNKKYKDKGFEVLGVSLDHPNTKEQVVDAMKRLGVEWPVIYDGKYYQADAAVKNKVDGIPMTFLLDRKGKARYANLQGKELSDAIEELLNEKQ